jgi:uncharacterized oxidoreductase
VFVASQGGKAIRDDALVGPDGKPSDDPRLLYWNYITAGRRDIASGARTLRPFGDHIGSGLALISEVLGGALSGTGCTSLGRRIANRMFPIHIDPGQVDPQRPVCGRCDVPQRFREAGEAGSACGGVLIPGEPERRMPA